ncbi:hypothetical protein SEA_EDUGATOR_72 [Mycobacterium phage Edugator]|uniref:Uncharacterized protein n=1 Tax=Mycobacterium phage Edugator TaxID=2015843 RepID=A0A222ZN13_9CAUD|nr:hypothetical protein SEA_EDUGATOR_72 [Mycobacterium phage Edugator]
MVSAQRLSAKSVRRIERSTGLQIVRAWAHGGYTFEFVTADHEHGTWNKKTGAWSFHTGRVVHYTSCSELFPTNPPEAK